MTVKLPEQRYEHKGGSVLEHSDGRPIKPTEPKANALTDWRIKLT